MKRKSLLTIMAIAFGLTVYAQHDSHHDSHHGEADHGDAHHKENHHHKHHVAVFNGITSNFDHHLNGYTLGVDYIYHLGKHFGIGVLGETIIAESSEYIIGIPLIYKPFKGLKIGVSPLMVFAEEHHEPELKQLETDPHHADTHTEDTHTDDHKKVANNGIRLALGYDFHFGKVAIGPLICYDRVKSNSLVYGLTVGLGF